jgi:hypothetical protein
MELAVRQYHVVIERAAHYRSQCTNAAAWMELLLPTSLTNPPVTVSFTQQNFDTAADIDMPHGEFIFGPMPNGMFCPIQMLRHVTVMQAGQRMLLWAGYHRSYARMLSTTPTAADRSALVALTSNTLVPPSNVAGVTDVGGTAGLDLWGRRPPLFGDFFADGLFMSVRLRKKRYQLQVRSRWVALDM